MSTEELGATLRQARQGRGLSQQALADRAAVSRNFVAQIERGESIPTVATLSRLAAALATTVGELLGEELPTTEAGDAIAVPVVADRIAAGPPLFVADHLDGHELLPRALLRNLGTDPAQAMLVRLGPDQDSMADTIPPGATVLLDRTPVREVVSRGIYAVREEIAGEMGCTIKRLVLDADARVLILLSDNPAYLPRALRLKAGQRLADTVVGRVMWWTPPRH
ncbi:MAG: XRE family transcriptional regulator [Thermoanaerobaculales bacterium]|jgi:transcriptional regulator with XRE-family HTH domain